MGLQAFPARSQGSFSRRAASVSQGRALFIANVVCGFPWSQELSSHPRITSSATPHKGDPENFCLFLELLDRDIYGSVKSLEEIIRRLRALQLAGCRAPSAIRESLRPSSMSPDSPRGPYVRRTPTSGMPRSRSRASRGRSRSDVRQPSVPRRGTRPARWPVRRTSRRWLGHGPFRGHRPSDRIGSRPAAQSWCSGCSLSEPRFALDQNFPTPTARGA